MTVEHCIIAAAPAQTVWGLCLTVIGIANEKIIPISLVPLGTRIVRTG